ncbi:MAG: ATP-binding protein [Planctomycetia bacterium]|nr:ATP-binding protein [Planctomycetia bacterium]
MYGPPGNGKTFIAKAIAGELNAAFFSVSGADIKDKYVGETEKNMKRLFEEAAKYDPAIVFIDEIQSLLARRGNEKVSAVDQFLVMTDGVISRKNNLLLLGATNYPWMLDDAVFRRLQKLIYVGMPDAPARNKIFRLQFEGVPTNGELPYDEFEEESKQFSGADIARICGTAKKIALQRIKTTSSDPMVCADDVFQAIRETRPSVNQQLIQKYKDWEKSFFGADSSFHDEA